MTQHQPVQLGSEAGHHWPGQPHLVCGQMDVLGSLQETREAPLSGAALSPGSPRAGTQASHRADACPARPSAFSVQTQEDKLGEAVSGVSF